jgi:3-oxoacyl-(acyl-carrier-protein) synthase/enoyl-CoA hydratase/carnithine racemase/acyl carrier protein/NADP-dependent 3-hydroxy acid dehydrogenase YdfG/SAM-dependent methyltransferase
MSDQKKIKFSTIMRNDDLIVRDHRVFDVRIMPGVTFLDMMYRMLKSKGFPLDEIELRTVLFKEPIVTSPVFDKKIEITFEQQTATQWRVDARSQKIKDDHVMSPEWVDNLECELHTNVKHPAKTLPVEQLKASALRIEDMDDNTYTLMRKTGIDHYEFMKLLGHVYIGRDYRLAEVQICDLAKQYTDYFHLHPAFLDGSTCVADALMLSQHGCEPGRPFIPIFMQTFRAVRPFGDKLYVHVPERGNVISASNDIIYADIELYDGNGAWVGEFQKFGFKKVRTEGLIMNLQQVDRTPAAAASQPVAVVAEGGEQRSIRDDLRQMIAELTRTAFDDVSVEAGFYDQGLDSRQLLELVQQLEQKLSTRLYPTLLFEYTNINKLAEFLEAEYGAAYKQSLGGQTTATAAATAPAAVATPAATAAPVAAPAPTARPTGASLRTLIQNDLREMVAGLQGRAADDVSLEAGFYDQGLDSRNLLELVQQLESKLGQKLYPTLLFEYTNIVKLAEYIETDHGSTYPVRAEAAVSQATAATEVAAAVQTANSTSATTATATTTASAQADFYYRPQWVASPLATGHAQTTGGKTVLIVAPAQSFGLAEGLAAAHAQDAVYHIELGAQTAPHGDKRWEINTRDAGALEHVLGQTPAADAIYFLGGLGQTQIDLQHLQAVDDSQEQGVLSLFRLIKALGNLQRTRQLSHLKVVTNNVHAVFADEPVVPYAASLFGLAKTAAREYPRTAVSCLDLDLQQQPQGAALQALVEAIVNEPSMTNGQEAAIRGGKRYAQVLQPVQLPGATTTLLKHNGVYLIVGGAGGIGLEWARHLATTVQARVVLVGRSALNDGQRRQIADIEARGGRVLYVQADATKEEDLRRAIAQAKSTFGGLNGVVHSAIVLRDKTLPTMDEATFRAALAPKVTGTAALHKALGGETLDFLLFFSSVQSYLGNVGQSNYAAACTFKDAFAHAIDQQVPYPVKIINWGFWGSIGVVATDDYNKQLAAIGVHSIDPHEGMAAIDQVLGLPIGQLIPFKAEAWMLDSLGAVRHEQAVLASSNMPSLIDVVGKGLPGVIAKGPSIDLARREQAQSAYQRFCRVVLLEAFQSMNVFKGSGERYTVDGLRDRLGIVAGYQQLLAALLDILADEGFLSREGLDVVTTAQLGRADLQQEIASLETTKVTLVERFPDLKAYVNLVWACVKSYPEVLTGRKNHVAVMFPRGSMELVEGIYKGNELSDYFNKIVGDAVQLYVEERIKRDPQAKIRILEIGAGTGGTSAFVLKGIKPYAQHLNYCFTDIAIEFTRHNDPEYRDNYPFVEFRALNIESDPLAQGYDANGYDVIFGTNVLHATKDISNSLRNAKKLLKENGLVVINEVTMLRDYLTLTFGLTSGWWLFEDGQRRIPGSPMLETQDWKAVLAANGMHGFRVFSLPGHTVETSEQNVMIAQGDGYVVQAKSDAPSVAAAPVQPVAAPAPVVQAPTVPAQPQAVAQPQAPAPQSASLADQDIAIIGVSGRYPQAGNLFEYWENLKNGRDSITEIPKDRWDFTEYFDPNRDEIGRTNSKWGGFLTDIDKFDPLFFNISPRDAELMDPQERLFLETVYQAVEDSGYTKSGLVKEKVGVYAGAMWGQYQMMLAEVNGRYVVPSSLYASIANRVSYYFDFHGPSMALDTMCSSSLTAIHLACESIRRGECSMAVAGGVNVTIHPNKYLYLSQLNFMSSEGKCRAFGEGGDGFVPGEGVGAIILKPLQRAVADGDRIYAVVKGSSLNHGGYASGYTVPNPHAQGDVILETLQKCNIDPRTISYIEAHGTGTSLGDPIEITGLKKAFGAYTNDKQFCAIGSAKSNIGHAEAAAGISGVTKLLLQFQHKQLAPSLHAEVLNKNIDFENTPFYVQRTLQDWKRPVIAENGQLVTYPRRAAISSFGAGGSNAHIIFEEYEAPVAATSGQGGAQLIVLSAKNEERLRQQARQLADFLSQNGANLTLASVAFTLLGREAMDERLAFVASDLYDVQNKLRAFGEAQAAVTGLERGNVKKAKAQSPSEEALELVRSAARDRQFSQLAQLFVVGFDLDAASLFPQGKPERVSLPHYPFARKRYWTNSFRGTAVTTTQAASQSAPYVAEAPRGIELPQRPAGKVLDSFQPTDYRGDEVRLEIIEDSIALVTMQDRANRNMFSDTLVRGLMHQFHKIQNNPNIKAVVLTGYDNIFSMGGTQDQLNNIADRKQSFTDVPFMFRGLLECEVPVIAAIQGHASGGGLLFGLYADIIVMSEESVYSAVFTKYGFTPGMGATLILKEKLGGNLATEMMFTAKSFRGEELKDRGASVLFRKGGDVVREAISVARMMSDKPRHTLKVLKNELAGRILAQLPSIVEREQQMHAETFTHPEVKARIERFYLSSQTHAAAAKETAVAKTEATPTPASKPKLKLKSSTVAAPEPTPAPAPAPTAGADAFDEGYYNKLLADLEAGTIDPDQALRKRGQN